MGWNHCQGHRLAFGDRDRRSPDLFSVRIERRDDRSIQPFMNRSIGSIEEWILSIEMAEPSSTSTGVVRTGGMGCRVLGVVSVGIAIDSASSVSTKIGGALRCFS